MAELLKVRCSQGHLIITDTEIIVELHSLLSGRVLRSQAMERSTLVDIDTRNHWLAFRGRGATDFAFWSQGRKAIRAGLVKQKDAEAVIALLRER